MIRSPSDEENCWRREKIRLVKSVKVVFLVNYARWSHSVNLLLRRVCFVEVNGAGRSAFVNVCMGESVDWRILCKSNVDCLKQHCRSSMGQRPAGQLESLMVLCLFDDERAAACRPHFSVQWPNNDVMA